jgi:hypothetical protein
VAGRRNLRMLGKLSVLIASIFLVHRLAVMGLFTHVVPESRFTDCESVQGLCGLSSCAHPQLEACEGRRAGCGGR